MGLNFRMSTIWTNRMGFDTDLHCCHHGQRQICTASPTRHLHSTGAFLLSGAFLDRIVTSGRGFRHHTGPVVEDHTIAPTQPHADCSRAGRSLVNLPHLLDAIAELFRHRLTGIITQPRHFCSQSEQFSLVAYHRFEHVLKQNGFGGDLSAQRTDRRYKAGEA